MTVEEVQKEVSLLTLDNIRKYPCSRSKIEDFYNMWQRFGPTAARTIMIPDIFNSELPPPSEYFRLSE